MPLNTNRPLRPRSAEELREREAERGERFRTLADASRDKAKEKRRERKPVCVIDVTPDGDGDVRSLVDSLDAAVREQASPGLRVPVAPLPPEQTVRVSAEYHRASFAPIGKKGQLVSEKLKAEARSSQCAFCHEGPWPEHERELHTIDPHHVQVRGNRRDEYDLTLVPACRGPATKNCHDRAQVQGHKDSIPLTEQYRALGEYLCRLLRRLDAHEHVEWITQALSGLSR